MARDASFDTLLDLDGTVGVIDEGGYWVKFNVKRVPVTAEQPHGLGYELTLHDPSNGRIAGFDNAHAVSKRSGPGGQAHEAWDHRHRFKTVNAYEYSDAEALLSDFWRLVESVMRELGVWK